MLTFITALLLPTCTVTAHAVGQSTGAAAGLTSRATQAERLAQSEAVVVPGALSLVDALAADEGQTAARRLLAKKKKSQKQKKKMQEKKEKKKEKKEEKKAKKKARRFKWKGKGKNGLKFKSNRPKTKGGIFKNGEIVYNADGIKCAATKKETDLIEFSKSAELHATAVAEAVEYLCNPPADFKVDHLVEIFEEDEAVAFANVRPLLPL
eukprot:jgi/Ulvmu1/8349/UM042_0055.1